MNETKIIDLLDKQSRSVQKIDEKFENQGKVLEKQSQILEKHGQVLENQGNILGKQSETILKITTKLLEVKEKVEEHDVKFEIMDKKLNQIINSNDKMIVILNRLDNEMAASNARTDRI